MRGKKLMAMLICIVLSIMDILSIGFSVSARELEQQPSFERENEPQKEETSTVIAATEVEEIETKQKDLEESKVDENKTEETEIQEIISEEESTEIDTQEENSFIETQEEISVTEIESQESSSIIDTQVESSFEEIETNYTESEILEQEIEKQINEGIPEDAIASGKRNNITWVIDSDGKLTVTGTGDFIEYKTGESFWYEYKDQIIYAEINVTGAEYAYDMFGEHNNLQNVDLSNFDMSNITDISGMFYDCKNLKKLDLKALDTSNVQNMGGMFFGCSGLVSLDISNFNTRNVTSMSSMFYGCNSLTNLDISSFDTSNVTDMSSMFSYCSSLINLDISSFDTSNVTNMREMFYNCNNLINLDISSFDTSNVTDMREMFSGCSRLSNINVSNFDTKNVTDMYGVFYDCSSLTNLDVSGFNTENVTNIGNMFSGCSRLLNINVSNFDTKNVTNMNSVFYGCSSLTNLDLSGLDVSNVISMSSMFGGCNNLNNLDISNFDTKKVTNMDRLFSGCERLICVDMSNLEVGSVEDWEDTFRYCLRLDTIYTPCNLTKSVSLPKQLTQDVWYQSDGTEIIELPRNLNYSIKITKNNVPSASVSHIEAEKTKTIYVCGEALSIEDLTVRLWEENGSVVKITEYTTNIDTIDMTTEGKKILEISYNDMKTSIELTVVKEGGNVVSGEYGNITWTIDTNGKLTVEGTGEFTEAGNSFNRAPWYDDRALIYTAEINVTDIKNISYMFNDCINLVSLDLSGFDTKNTRYSYYMFNNCISLQSLDLSNFNTENIVSMYNMFSYCVNLESLNLNGFNTRKVMYMNNMFTGCSSLKNLDLDGFSTERVISMTSMFSRCTSLEDLDLSGFDTENVTNMSSMFSGCASLKNLDLSGFDTENVTNMSSMFSGCASLKNLDLSGFDTENVTDMSSMFVSCNELKSLDLSGFDVKRVTDVRYMIPIYGNLTTIYTPCNLTQTVELTSQYLEDTWYGPDGTIFKELPQNLPYSILLTKNTTSMTVEPHIVANKSITVYNCGENLNLDDLIVRFYDSDGTVKSVTDYNTNKDEIDLSILGTKMLIITYNDMTTSIALTVIEKDANNIASGSYNNITWVIDARGKLIVTGTGDFAEVSGDYTRVPWYLDRSFITSAEIRITGATDVSYMLYACSNLKRVDLSGLDIDSTVDTSHMLDFCRNLIEIDTPCNLTQFISLPINESDDIWYQSDGKTLTELPQNLGYSIKIARNSIPKIEKAYITVQKLKTTYICDEDLNIDDLIVYFFNIDGTITKVTDFSTNASEIDMSTKGEKELKVIYKDMEVTVDLTVIENQNIASGNYREINWIIDAYGNLIVTGRGDFASPIVDKYKEKNRAPWYDYRDKIITANVDVTDMTDASYMFYDCNHLTSIDLSGFDTKNVSNMTGMFSYCRKLTSLDLSCLDTANVNDMSYMFDYCISLCNIDMSKFNTNKVTNMSAMFQGCNSLISLDVNNFNTKNVVDMSGMFCNCSKLEFLDVSNFDTSNVERIDIMFGGCRGLTSLDVSNFNTSSVIDMVGMFSECSSLSSLDLTNFNTSNVTNMLAMFENCTNLTNLNLNSFDTKNVEYMSSMFDGCSSLTNLDITNFDTSNVVDMSAMFYNCNNLTSLNISGFDIGNVGNMTHMFEKCSKLSYLDLSSFDLRSFEDEYGESKKDVDKMLDECFGLNTICTPYNLTESIVLPKEKSEDVWYQPNGTAITELPRNLSESIMITKNHIPIIDESYITVQKRKTVYACGEILNIDDLTVKFYDTNGTVKVINDYITNADKIDMSTVGMKNLVITYNNLTAEIELIVIAQQDKTYTVIFDMGGHGVAITPITNITIGSLIAEPQHPVAEGYRFMGWYKDSSYIYIWDFDRDTVQENIILYAYWVPMDTYMEIGNLIIQEIPTQTYTGKALKPTVTVYCQSINGRTLLKSGKDYTIRYFNNIQSDTETEKFLGGVGQTELDNSNGFTKDLAYVVITCKGNYTGSVYQNFHISAASITNDGQHAAKNFTLKCTEQFISSRKAVKPFDSIKYKQTMKAGIDYIIKITAQKAYDDNKNILTENSIICENSAIPTIPAGYQGTFLMTLTGINNYRGTISKTIYIADKNHLMKNAKIIIGKNQKNIKYTGKAITLTPAWYDSDTQKYYAIGEMGEHIEADKNNVFMIKIGTEYLLYGRDFTISYLSNQAVGNATMIVTGIGDYVGTKNIIFHITGTAFNTKNIQISNFSPLLIYTGEAHEQSEIILADNNSTKLVLGTDYTVSYKNNIKKGTATMIFTAKPASGYSGSFKKTFKIVPAELKDITNINVTDSHDTVTMENGKGNLNGRILYTKEGVKPSEKIVLKNRNNSCVLKAGIDYTVSYANNKTVTENNSLATMTIKGKGNYTGNIVITFPIMKAPLLENENLNVTAVSVGYNMKKTDDYQYRPQIKITDKKKVLSASKDFEIVEYKNCSQAAVRAYLSALEQDIATADIRPYALIRAREGSGYEGTIEVDLTIFQTKLTAKNLYILISDEAEQTTFTGEQVKPMVTVYYGQAESVKMAKNARETEENILTSQSGNYKLEKLNFSVDGTGDYILSYGINIKAGKNKGLVTVSGAGLYGGKVTAKFTIIEKNIYDRKETGSDKNIFLWYNADKYYTKQNGYV